MNDLVGLPYGRLTVCSYVGVDEKHYSLWKCLCLCGNTTIVRGADLRSGNTGSCGCRTLQRVTRHGQSRTAIYFIWKTIRQRCCNPKCASYKNYGGRGIKMCLRWKRSFECFAADVGTRPSSKHSIDRIRNNGNYTPGNVKWSTAREQALNRRKRERKE
jgi:hypothetical protein